jgi:hypothetical protein
VNLERRSEPREECRRGENRERRGECRERSEPVDE